MPYPLTVLWHLGSYHTNTPLSSLGHVGVLGFLVAVGEGLYPPTADLQHTVLRDVVVGSSLLSHCPYQGQQHRCCIEAPCVCRGEVGRGFTLKMVLSRLH